MEFHTDVIDETTVAITPEGRLTMVSAADLRAVIDRVVANGHTLVVVDLAETPFMDSSGLGALVGGLRTTRGAGGDLRIARATEQIRTVLELTTMDRVFRPYPSVAEAVGGAG